jgi:hypothetical protein
MMTRISPQTVVYFRVKGVQAKIEQEHAHFFHFNHQIFGQGDSVGGYCHNVFARFQKGDNVHEVRVKQRFAAEYNAAESALKLGLSPGVFNFRQTQGGLVRPVEFGGIAKRASGLASGGNGKLANSQGRTFQNQGSEISACYFGQKQRPKSDFIDLMC